MRGFRPLVSVLFGVLLTLTPGLGRPIAAHPILLSDATISANDDLDAYVGTGGLLLPRSFDGAPQTRSQVADCLSCVWKYSLYCAQDATVACAHAVTTCSSGRLRYRVKFGVNAQNVATIGSVCWGKSYPATRHQVSDRIRDDALRAVPPLRPNFVPTGESLVGVPVIAWSGQPEIYRAKPMNISGIRVAITARPIWRWTWGDSTMQWTSIAGSASSRSGPTHRYSTPGNYRIGVQTVWTASYSISGLGTYTVADAPLNQYAQLDVHIVPSKTRLVVREQRP